ncbi:MAG: hypothetical protein AABW67_00845 [Nanoarchaeota archaeon]
MKKSLILGLVVALFLITNISATISFTQIEQYYNLGDIIETEVSVNPILEGFLKVDLVCDTSINVFNGLPDDAGKIKIKFPLTSSYIKDLEGSCYFLVEYPEISQKSDSFEISRLLDIKLDVEKFVSNPSDEIIVSGNVKRLNGNGSNGEVEITIPLLGGNNQTFSGKIVEGLFRVSIRLNENTPAKTYTLNILAYEKDSLDRITSEGTATGSLKINQILKKADIAMVLQSINPDETLEFKPMLIDQGGEQIIDDARVVITDSNFNKILEKIVKSSETSEYKIQSNLSSGYYGIQVSSKNISANKKFYVNEKAIANFEVVGDMLIVTNIGNIPYEKDMEVMLNGVTFVKSVKLGLGEQKEFRLTGDGEYDLQARDGETSISKGGISLTGNVIGIKEIKKGLVALNTPIIWIFFIVILGAGLLFAFRNVLKQKSFAYHVRERFGFKPKIDSRASQPSFGEGIKQSYIPIKISFSNKAEPVLVMDGNKTPVAVLVIKIKNKLNDSNKESLKQITELISERHGAFYEKGEYLTIIFSPLVTKSYQNEIAAIKTAGAIRKAIIDSNHSSVEKIEFGMGIGSGEIINKVERGILKFTSLGNLIPSIKKLAEDSKQKVLLTKLAYEKAGVSVKAVKKEAGVYQVTGVVDSEQNQKFIKNFLERNNRGKDLLKE